MADGERAGVHGVTADVVRGVCRMLLGQGLSPLQEFSLPNGRRTDIAAVDGAGVVSVVEVKVSVADFRADEKWPGYLDYCDRFFFAVPEGFPQDLLPAEHGLIVADRFGAAVLREAPAQAMAPARRKAFLVRFARTAAERYVRLADPALLSPD